MDAVDETVLGAETACLERMKAVLTQHETVCVGKKSCPKILAQIDSQSDCHHA
jgi:hypothetical protein